MCDRQMGVGSEGHAPAVGTGMWDYVCREQGPARVQTILARSLTEMKTS